MGMKLSFFRNTSEKYTVHSDAALRYKAEKTGLGAIVYTSDGTVKYTWRTNLDRLCTSNEGEYLAAIWTLKKLLTFGIKRVQFYSDSKVMVDQMNGRANVNSQRLQPLFTELCRLARQFKEINFTHVHREENRLADALANMAADEAMQKVDVFGRHV